jgi:hypothetical protein
MTATTTPDPDRQPGDKPKVWMFLATKYPFTRAGLESLGADMHAAGSGARFLRSHGYLTSNDQKRLSQFLRELQDNFRRPRPTSPPEETTP